MSRSYSRFAGLLVAATTCAGIVLVGIYPYHPANLIGWLLLALLAIPIVLLLELSGNFLLESKRMQQSGPIMRIIGGLLAILVICVLILLAWGAVKPQLTTWG